MMQAVQLPEHVTVEQGACLGIPGITAHRAVRVAGPVSGRTVLVQAAPARSACVVRPGLSGRRPSSLPAVAVQEDEGKLKAAARTT